MDNESTESVTVAQEKPRYSLLQPAKSSGLFQEVGDHLREAILQGRFRPGERLREAELAAMLEVSRGPVREALARLEHEGLVITRRNRGASVVRLTREDEEEVRSLRLVIERLAVQLAVQHATEADIDALKDEIDRLRGAGPRPTVQELAEFEVRFDDLLFSAARHKRLSASWRALRSQLFLLLASRSADRLATRDALLDRHTALLGAVRSRNEQAALTLVGAGTVGPAAQPSVSEEIE
jgi:DNA-binding GntR family transcriptional regulator